MGCMGDTRCMVVMGCGGDTGCIGDMGYMNNKFFHDSHQEVSKIIVSKLYIDLIVSAHISC